MLATIQRHQNLPCLRHDLIQAKRYNQSKVSLKLSRNVKNKLYLSPSDQILRDTEAGFHDRKYYTYFDWL